MRSRAVLAGVVVAAVLVAALLLLWPRSTSHEGSELDQPVGGTAAGSGGTGGGQGSVARDEDAPSAGDGEGESDRGDEQPGGVRDHRGETPSRPRTRWRPGDRPRYVVARPVIADLRRSLRPEIERCSDEHGQGLAADALIQGSLQVTVHSGVLSVVGVHVEHRGIPETSGLIDCARKAFAAAEVRAEGHEDVEKHVLRLPFKVPVK